VKKIYSFVFLLVLIPVVVAAQVPAKSGRLSRGSKGFGFYGSVSAKGGLGSSGADDTNVVDSRDHYRYGAEATLGLRYGAFLIGASGEYNLWKQKTKPSKVDDTNMSGRQINIAPIAGLSLGPFLLLGKTHLKSTMTLDKKSAGGDEVVYTSPSMPGYSAQLNYKIGSMSFIGVEYSSITYKKVEVDGESDKLDSKNQVTYSGWGLVYGFMF
jgi:hypothetical protein